MFETVRHDAKGKSLNLCLGLFRGVPISEDAREINDFSDPATVFFLFNFNSKLHVNKSYAFPQHLKRIVDAQLTLTYPVFRIWWDATPPLHPTVEGAAKAFRRRLERLG